MGGVFCAPLYHYGRGAVLEGSCVLTVCSHRKISISDLGEDTVSQIKFSCSQKSWRQGEVG